MNTIAHHGLGLPAQLQLESPLELHLRPGVWRMDSLVVSDNASSRHGGGCGVQQGTREKRLDRKGNGTCAQCTSQDPRILGFCHASNDAVHHIVHCIARAVFSANQRSTICSFLPAHLQTPLRGLCMPQSLGLVDFFFNCSMLHRREQTVRWTPVCMSIAFLAFYLPCSTLYPGTAEAAASQIYLVKMQYMGIFGPACLTIAAEMLRRSAVSQQHQPSAAHRSRLRPVAATCA
ncbi:hypothetical protein M441DRAFT_407032 [Trichoderma asperellum CBS 433.97]|uniref:Uncharacterized protein n=1 Tax=Trichoderma asperellum (strain ATCC 204424 / CBS 433.97 / NBRC 101777) TaxID=1042311 RepID=A0A2T3Z6P7_TRIA4|nr:hypothetical protein M441DRAFT_407032 [Trichoderma asperellum CBS 433.97]PTB40486.1 hypothetical protein M441DRAFT_407032 [Trichoderma asperellum CBS 433.97]